MMGAVAEDLGLAPSSGMEKRGEGASQATLEDVLARLAVLEGKIAANTTEDRISLIVFSGSLDRMIAAFVLASTAAASGMQVEMFFTFWGLAALRDHHKSVKKDWLSRMFGWMLPRGMKDLPLSTMNMGGAGPVMIRQIMKKKRFSSLEEMLSMCAEFGVKIFVCDMSREVMGISADELIDYPHLHYCGAASFLEKASGSRISMFL
jgi:peroxiredoxin family protein